MVCKRYAFDYVLGLSEQSTTCIRQNFAQLRKITPGFGKEASSQLCFFVTNCGDNGAVTKVGELCPRVLSLYVLPEGPAEA
jgi:hypothetical protein